MALPRISIDHLGLSRDGFDVLMRLVDHGARVKASGFGRVDLDVSATLRQIYAVNPAALLFGTDLPSTRAPRPFLDSDIDLIVDALGEQAGQRVLYENAAAFYPPNTTDPHNAPLLPGRSANSCQAPCGEVCCRVALTALAAST